MQMNRYVVDTSFLVSFFNNKDVNHLKALEFMSTMYHEYLIIPTVVIAELASFRKNKKFRDLIIGNVFNIASEICSLNEANIFEYLSFIENFDINLRAMDSVILFSAVQGDAELLTFDEELLKVYSKLQKQRS